MYWIPVSALGALWYFYYKGRRKTASGSTAVPVETVKVRKNQQAQTFQDIHQSLAALKKITDPLERHTLYTQVIDAAYKKRHADKKMRSLVIESGTSYLCEFPDLKAVVLKEFDENPKIVTVFKQLAIVFEEDEAFDRAMDICRAAMTHELEDGTKTGYEGRLERLMRKKEKSRLDKGGN